MAAERRGPNQAKEENAMEAIRNFFYSVFETLGKKVPTVIGALVILIVGIVAAHAVRSGTEKLLRKAKLDDKLKAGRDGAERIEAVISSIVYYGVLLFVLLLTLSILGVQGVLDPLRDMLSEFWGALPNIVAAGLIGFVGYVVAKIVSVSVQAVSSPLDKSTEKLGLGESFALSRLIGQIVFLFVFIPILIAALQVLEIQAISAPAISMLTALMAAVPKILAAALILAVAYLVGRFVTGVVTELLRNLGADSLPEKLRIDNLFTEERTFSKVCGGIVLFFIMLAATVSAVGKLDMPQLTAILASLLLFGGHIILGVVIVGIGSLIANMAYGALSKGVDTPVLASIVRIAILGLVLAMGLRAMGIADDIVNLAFGLTLGALAVTVALSFGIGGRQAAGKQMEYWFSKWRGEGKNTGGNQ
jgi:hypothetical protein